MSKESDTQHEPTVQNDMLVLIIFSSTPSECEIASWYWTPIAGVPFLLRNVINIQRGGGNRIVLYHNKQIVGTKELCRLVNDDPRVRNKTEWISESGDLEQLTRSMKNILILNGSALHHKTDIQNAISSLTQYSVTDRDAKKEVVNIDNLHSFFENYDDFDELWSEKMIAISAVGKLESRSNDSNCISYMPGGRLTKITKEEDFQIQDERIMKSGGLETDSIINRFLSRSVSRFLTRLAIRIPVSPNQITLLSFFSG